MNRYLVMVIRHPHFDVEVVPLRLEFLDALGAQGQIELSGPFGDKSGGAYLRRGADLEEATATSDPAHVSSGWGITVHEWQAH